MKLEQFNIIQLVLTAMLNLLVSLKDVITGNDTKQIGDK